MTQRWVAMVAPLAPFTLFMGCALLACLVLQERGMLLMNKTCSILSARGAWHSACVLQATGESRSQIRARAPCNSSMDSVSASTIKTAAWTSIPVSIGSCAQHTNSSFPYVGNDVFIDYAHKVFESGTGLTLKGPSIVFMHPQDVPAFAAVVPTLQHKVVLVSNSNSDQCLPWAHGDNIQIWQSHVDAILNSSMVTAWWGPNVVMAHPKLKHLPLGSKWNWQLAYHHAEDENKGRLLAVFSKWASNPAANFRLPKANLLFVQMSKGSSDNAVYTPTRGHRRVAVKAAQAILAAAPQPTIQALDPNQRACADSTKTFEHVQRLEQYLFTVRQYKFVLSPVGNGVDTHRTWETLLAGSIPIVESSVRDSMYEGLPVLILKSWNDLSMELLQTAYTELTAAGKSYHWEKLFAPYYLNQMTADLLLSYMSDSSP